MHRVRPVAPLRVRRYRRRMDPVVAGFWGAFFGTAALMLAGGVAAFVFNLKRVAFMASSASAIFVVFVVSYLGMWPVDDDALRMRIDANVFMASAAPLGHLVLAMIGHLRVPVIARRWRTGLYGFAMVAAGTGWLLPAEQAFVLATFAGFLIGAVALALGIRRARRGDRLAWLAICGVLAICISAGALSAIALDPRLPWPVHALGAVAGMAYLSVIAVVLWLRFSYLIELREVVTHGAAYDPITRMRKHSETGQMVGIAFFDQVKQGSMVGVIAVSIGNLVSLEKLHGRAAANHGLFVAAGRLRRALPGGFEAGRLGEDAFLVLARAVGSEDDLRKLVELGHEIVQRLSRPVVLSTSAEPGELEAGQAHWVAQVGVGIVLAEASQRPSEAVTLARTMSRAAWGFPSRVAWQNHQGHVSEAPLLASA
jgi:GGDEF domain-containing protein